MCRNRKRFQKMKWKPHGSKPHTMTPMTTPMMNLYYMESHFYYMESIQSEIVPIPYEGGCYTFQQGSVGNVYRLAMNMRYINELPMTQKNYDLALILTMHLYQQYRMFSEEQEPSEKKDKSITKILEQIDQQKQRIETMLSLTTNTNYNNELYEYAVNYYTNLKEQFIAMTDQLKHQDESLNNV
jgi:hypothetical protein